MRFFITLLALCFASYTLAAAQGTCSSDSLCMGCNNDATTCFSCYNWTSTKLTAKQFASNACATNVANTVTDCKYYNGTITATKTLRDCLECNGKTWLNLTTDASAANYKIACSDTALNATHCSAAVANCSQSICYKPLSGNEQTLCAKCAVGYKGDGTLVAGVGYPTCTNSSIVSNCSIGATLDATKCEVCASSYAVSDANDTECKAFNADANCRKMGGATWCKECVSGYYFKDKVCTLSSSLMMFSGLVLSALMFFN